MHEPRKIIGEKLPEGMASPDVHAANRKYTGTKNISERAEKSLYAIDQSDLMLSPAHANDLEC